MRMTHGAGGDLQAGRCQEARIRCKHPRLIAARAEMPHKSFKVVHNNRGSFCLINSRFVLDKSFLRRPHVAIICSSNSIFIQSSLSTG